jgi:hypothetical protein
MDTLALGRVFSEQLGSLAIFHSTNFSHSSIIPSLLLYNLGTDSVINKIKTIGPEKGLSLRE